MVALSANRRNEYSNYLNKSIQYIELLLEALQGIKALKGSPFPVSRSKPVSRSGIGFEAIMHSIKR